MFYFTLGIFWAKAWSKSPRHIVLFLSSVTLFLFFKIDPLHLSSLNSTLWSFLWFMPLSYAIVWFGYNGPKILWQLNRLDDISMGIFIWHMVIINIFLYTGIDKSLSDYPLILILIAVTAAVAFLSYRIVEKPALKLRSIKDKQTSKTKDCELMARGCSYVGSPKNISSLHKRANLSLERSQNKCPPQKS
jgi:peptidoglycan/LPS O-acetylase OafA/YrhL